MEPTGAPAPAPLLIGVRFSLAGEIGEIFADAKAVEAAGADSLWIAAPDGAPHVLLAALPAATWRVPPPGRRAPGDPRGREPCAKPARRRLLTAHETKE